MMKLLVNIAFHYNEENIIYLEKLLESFINEYEVPVNIIIDTNSDKINYLSNNNIKVVVHDNLVHPYHLTWMHRKHIKDNIDKYDIFMYAEHDMYVPYINYLNYLDNFKMLFPRYVPSFIRIEKFDKKEYIVDIIKKQKLVKYYISDKKFTRLDNPYHAFWIMPKEELIKNMTSNFVRVDYSRELAASYLMWELKKPTMLELNDNNNISNKCYSYHLTNNYVSMKNSPFAKIEVDDIFYR